MSWQWIQVVPGVPHLTYNYSPFESIYASETSHHPIMATIIGNSTEFRSTMGWNDIPDTGLSLTTIRNGQFRALLNTISVHRARKTFNVASKAPTAEYRLRYQSAKGFLIRVSYVLSDLICFFAKDWNEAANAIVAWVAKCRKIKAENRPSACVVLTTTDSNIVHDLSSSRFELFCNSRLQLSGSGNMALYFIRDVQVFRFQNPSLSLPSELFDMMEASRDSRVANCRLWSTRTFSRMAGIMLPHMAKSSSSYLKYAEALDMTRLPRSISSVESWLGRQWADLVSVTNAPELLTHSVIPILGRCLARDAMRLGHSKTFSMFSSTKLTSISSIQIYRCV